MKPTNHPISASAAPAKNAIHGLAAARAIFYMGGNAAFWPYRRFSSKERIRRAWVIGALCGATAAGLGAMILLLGFALEADPVIARRGDLDGMRSSRLKDRS